MTQRENYIRTLKERIEELEQQLAYECGCNAELVDTQNENEKLKKIIKENNIKPKEYYILRVLDNDDDYEYETLIYNNLDDYDGAREVIEKVNDYWYSDDFEENEETNGGFYKYLIIQLKKKNLFNPTRVNSIYVR